MRYLEARELASFPLELKLNDNGNLDGNEINKLQLFNQRTRQEISKFIDFLKITELLNSERERVLNDLYVHVVDL